jgi:asparagine N-glycosylation enzyme membrane subunit Stt3
MEYPSASSGKQKQPIATAGKLWKLTLIGGIVFWLTSILTSLLPIAAQYRMAFSNWSIYTVWIGSFFLGMLNSLVVSWLLLRIQRKSPDRKMVPLAVFLSVAVLILALSVVDLPMFLQGTRENLGYFFVGIAFNTVRFLLLGLSIGYVLVRSDRK